MEDQPFREPARSYLQLDEPTRKFLEKLDEDDIATLTAILRTYTKATTIGGFFKWLGIAMLATFTAVVTAGETARKVYGWLFG